jgi:glycosyltransferase involved in cell wall biosynthesis
MGDLESVFLDLHKTVEYVVVDDRSPDGTWIRLVSLAETFSNMRAIRLQKNVGQMAATLCGIAEAAGDVIVTMDDDLQHPPSEVPKLLAALSDAPEWDVVIGSWERGNDGIFRSVGGRLFERLQNLAVPHGSHVRHTGFRAFRRQVGEAMVGHGTRHPVISSLLFEVAGSIHNVEVDHAPRAVGESGFRLDKAVRLTIDNFVQSSALPLYWISGFGFVVALLAAIVGLVYVVRAIAGANTPPGWTSSFLAVVFFGGAILASVGLLGRYVAVIMEEVRRPPRWVIRDRIR